jgi:hypothetical protein
MQVGKINMLSEDKIIKKIDPSEIKLDTLIYKCQYNHQLEYTPKKPGKTIVQINCPHCMAKGLPGIPMLLKERKKKET